MVWMERFFGRDAKDGPTETFKHLVTLFIAVLHFGQVVNAAVNLNDKASARDGEIDDDSMDGMLPAGRETVVAQGAEGLPGDVFRGVGRFAEAAGAAKDGVVCQSPFSPSGRRGWG